MAIRKQSHQFSQVPRAEIPRSSFDRSHGYKTTFDAGFLVPIFLDEALPGDTFNCRMTGFARMATPIFPVMDNMYMETFFFAVPYRLIWDNWEKFNGAQQDPGDSTDYLIPQCDFDVNQLNVGTLGDYFGLPTGVAQLTPSSLPARAYYLIWNEWFRDQNLQDSIVFNKGDGPDPIGYYSGLPLRRGKRHDYFTSCLPWPQKGDSVDLPLGTSAPIIPAGNGVPTFLGEGAAIANSLGTPLPAGTSPAVAWNNAGGAQVASALEWQTTALAADLTTATAATINQLRQAFQIQKLLERDARGGTRYTEVVKAHFGVTSPDARLQRPEYLGGGRSMVNINPVAQTSGTPGVGEYTPTPQGNLAAFGTVSLHNHGFTKSFTEHCLVIGMVCVRADLTYQQGLNRMWSRQTRYDHYWPALSHIGEQAVHNKELYAQGTAADEDVFGYQERYAEYRYKPSQVTGLFRSNAATSLDAWHLAQDFSALPALNASFIEENPPIDRVIAVQDEPHFLFDSYFSLRCARPMPLFGVPGLIDHF